MLFTAYASEAIRGLTTIKRLDIQGLRALAVIAVVAYHAGIAIPGGFLGVDIFFVISGFVITGVLIRSKQRPLHLQLIGFYQNRARRLIPALSVLVAVVVIFSIILQAPFGAQQNTAVTGVGALLMSANLVLARITGGYFDLSASTNPLLHTWSLSVEEQFYLVFPAVVLWFLSRKFRQKFTFLTALILITSLISFFLTFWYNEGHWLALPSPVLGFFSPISRAWEFGIGSLVFFISKKFRTENSFITNAVGFCGISITVISLFAINSDFTTPGVSTLFPTMGTSLVLWAGSQIATSKTNQALSAPPLVWAGDISYSWYLWHWPVIVFTAILFPYDPLALVIAAVLSVIPAVLSYRYLEQPIRKNKLLVGKKLVEVSLSFTLVPLVLAIAVFQAAQNAYWMPSLQQISHATKDNHLGQAQNCVSNGPPSGNWTEECSWNSEASGKPIYLVGDSHADMVTEGLLEAAIGLDRPLRLESANTCPFVDIYITVDGATPQSRSDCYQYVQKTLDWLVQQPAGLVVISNSGDYFHVPQTNIHVFPDESNLSDKPIKPLTVYKDGLKRVVKTLIDSGKQVLILEPTPRVMPGWPNGCTMISLISDSCFKSITRHEALLPISDILVATREVAEETGASSLDLMDSICDLEQCGTLNRNNIVPFKDGDHISVEMSYGLEELLRQTIIR